MVTDSQMSNTQDGRVRHSRLFGQYIVKHAFQFKFSFGLLAIIGAATFVLWMESKIAIHSILRSGARLDPSVMEQLRVLNGIIANSSLLITALSFGFALYMTHFIAGPLLRFEKTFEQMAKGDLNVQIRLRKRDEFQEVANSFNECIVSLRQRLRRERVTVETAAKEIVSLSASLRQAGKGNEADQLDRISSTLTDNAEHINL